MRRATLIVLFALALLAAPVVACGTVEPPPNAPDVSERLREAVTPEGILAHERRFQEIADANGGNRAAGTPGYDASAEYVAGELRAAGYDVSVQEFEIPYYEEVAPAELEVASTEGRSYAPEEEFRILEYSGSGDVTAPVRAVDLGAPDASTSGCEVSDFADLGRGEVALIRRGTCPFGQKARNAEAAGAGAVVIFDEERETGGGVFSGTLVSPGLAIPVVGASTEVGEELTRLAEGGAEVRVAASTRSQGLRTSNVVAESRTGRDDRTVVVGAHLDSVPEGPGINDNGSGSATILEVARQMSALGIEPRNNVRFAFWGAEELGLLGSRHYVEGLTEAEIEAVDVYLNFDMLGSPNPVRFVYDGSGAPQGSEDVEEVFTDYFASQGLEATVDATLQGRSDHDPFAERGVPVGGLFSGAEGTKTEDEAASYGGEAGAPHDPCYHESCDDLGNLSIGALTTLSDAAAHATLSYAETE